MQRSSVARKEFDHRRVGWVYGALAGVYDGFFDWALEPGRVLAVEALECGDGDRVLEVGVGTGLSLPLYPRSSAVTGVDISEGMLRKARERSRDLGRNDVRLLEMDARDLRFPDGTFDRVLAPYVISVVPEPERVMREIARVCRPGGKVVVVNHFRSDHAVLGRLERWLTPASQWIGFRMDLEVERILGTPGLRRIEQRRVNLFGLWQLLGFRRDPGPGQ